MLIPKLYQASLNSINQQSHMESNDQNQIPQSTKSNPTNTATVRVHKDFARAFRRELAKLNKKDFSRRISFGDYVAIAFSILTDDH